MTEKKLKIQKPQKIEKPTEQPAVQEPQAIPPVTPPEKKKDIIEAVQDEMAPKPAAKPTGAHTAIFKDGIIPSSPGHKIIVANANQFRHQEEHDPLPVKHKAVISGDDNKVLRGN